MQYFQETSVKSTTNTATEVKATRRTKSMGGRITGTTVQPEHIAEAAYYKAMARGFAPGNEIDDWLNAEADLSKRALY
jgi:hypothetical protein